MEKYKDQREEGNGQFYPSIMVTCSAHVDLPSKKVTASNIGLTLKLISNCKVKFVQIKT